MAKYVVPPMGKENLIVKCYKCRTLYVPEPGRHPYGREDCFEKCPICGAGANNWENVIPLWRYNLIKWFRGGKILEQTDDRGTDD